MNTQTASPTTPSERLHVVDIIRGFALWGIFVFNMTSFAGYGLALQTFDSSLDRAIVLLIRFLVEAKFYSLFSFLFGWGMATQLIRAEARGTNFLAVYGRRLLVLLALGAIHGIFIWTGDILTTYALLGFVLLLFRNRSDRVLLVAMGLSLLYALVLNLPALEGWRTRYFDWLNFIHFPFDRDIYATGTFAEITRYRFAGYWRYNFSTPFFFGQIFAMLLLGLYVGKRRILENLHQEANQEWLKQVWRAGLFWGGLFSGLYAAALYASYAGQWPASVSPQWQQTIATFLRTLGAPLLMLFYATSIIYLHQSHSWRKQLDRLAPMGRMALSNYLFQSTIGTLIFYNYGLGLFGKASPLFGLILVFFIYGLQIRLSKWWLEHYSMGPVEWLWRWLTYGQRPRFRLAADHSNDPPGVQLRRWARQNQRSLIWGAVLLIGVTLLYWVIIVRPTQNVVTAEVAGISLPPIVIPPVVATPVPQITPAPPSSPPVLQPVNYSPGPLAQQGDLLGLAAAYDLTITLQHIEALAAPRYAGRKAGTATGAAAGDYIAQQFAAYGLQPAGDNGTYFQNFPLYSVLLEDVPTLIITTTEGTVLADYDLYTDYAPLVFAYTGGGEARGEVVWVNQCATPDFAQIDVRDKVVLCQPESSFAATRAALEHGAAALLLLLNPDEPLDRGFPFQETWVPTDLALPTLRITTAVAGDLLQGSGRTITDLSLITTPFATGSTLELDLDLISACGRETCQGRNVLAVLPGRDPQYADEIIIIGAHYDHMGQAPNGLTWYGANDNASGTATLLAIAQSWQAQGYVPRRTILFVAWDGEELGLLGSQYYVQHPRFPLENSIAMLNLDMVGGPGDLLSIDGEGPLAQRLQAAATSLGVATELTEIGRSDHTPFREAGIPASLIIWFGEEVDATYHRPTDTLETIASANLLASGRIAILTLFGLAEAEASIDAVLQQRAEAITSGNLDDFLATAAADQQNADAFWFNDVQSFAPISATVTAQDVFVTAAGIEATVYYRVAYPTDAGSAVLTATVNGLFTPANGNWHWAGANLRPVDAEVGGFAAAYPANQLTPISGLETYLDETYATIAAQLGQPATSRATVYLYPDAPSLRADTSLRLPDNVTTWVGPDTIKLVYTDNLTTTESLQVALTQLVLASAGLSEAEAPWLWHGLPLALPHQNDPVAAQRLYLPDLRTFLATEGGEETNAAANWATVEYLRQQVGWDGVGEFITLAGANGLETALTDTLGLSGDDLRSRGLIFWQERLASAQTDVDDLLQARAEAVLNDNQADFLNTVDSAVPYLQAEQRYWFAAAQSQNLTAYTLTGTPLAILDNGDILAELNAGYENTTFGNGTVRMELNLTRRGNVLRWGDVPFNVLSDQGLTIYYQAGQELLAQNLLTQTLGLNEQLGALVPFTVSPTMTLKVYDDLGAYQHSVMAGYPDEPWLTGWTNRGEALKLHLEGTLPPSAQLADLLLRYHLSQLGVTDEWLLQGVALYYREQLPGIEGVSAAANIPAMLSALSRNQLFPFTAIPPAYTLTADELKVMRPQAWDAVRYLVYTYGEERLLALLQAQASGQDLNAALPAILGLDPEAFQNAWVLSTQQAHIQAEWVALAQGFAVEQALTHVTVLTQPEMAGRLAGSAGSLAAAQYIADQFAAYGLEPAGTEGYFQPFTVPYTTLAAAPRLALVTADGQFGEDFIFYQEFMLTLGDVATGGAVTGELVYVADLSLPDLDLSGKIVVSTDEDTVVNLMRQAYERGASGLLLVTSYTRDDDYLVKQAITATMPPTQTVPTLLLTQIGYDHLLASTGLSRGAISTAPAALPLGGAWASLDIPLSSRTLVPTANVLGILPGNDPQLRDELIVITAHYDHVGDDPPTWLCNGQVVTDERVGDEACEQLPGLTFSGANDNASGVSILLEMAHLWQTTGYRPARSVLFVAWGAQEQGEVGSTYFAHNPTIPLENVIGLLNLDSIGGGPGPRLVGEGAWDGAGSWLMALNAAATLLDGRLRLELPTTGGDHEPFAVQGVPIVVLTWQDTGDANWPDTIAHEIDPLKLGNAGQILTLAVMALAR